MRLLMMSLPLSCALALLLFGRFIGNNGAKFLSIFSIFLTVIGSIGIIKERIEGEGYNIGIKEWWNIGITKGEIEIIYDEKTIGMYSLIAFITFIVISFSCWYMAEDPHLPLFLSYLLLFSLSMFLLVSSSNLFLLFLGWEGVGIMSYLLINFWYNSFSNNKSSLKALLFNKVGDIALLLALLLLSPYSFSFPLFSFVDSSLLYYALVLAAVAKSAQIVLHCWLGDAMAGPTPDSVLLHAATMVTAGVFLLVRIDHNPLSLLLLFIGSLTILFGGISSFFQYDIKKLIAFSTCAQIGFLFFSLSLFPHFSLYHLFTHGFFKALLFLTAGLLIHSLSLEQDLRKLGSLLYSSPLSFIFLLLASLSLIGFPTMSGFYSKDLILLSSFSFFHSFFFFSLLLGSLFSTLYSFKLLFFSFFNSPSILPQPSLHLSTSLFPLSLLVIGSSTLGFLLSSYFSAPSLLNFDLEHWDLFIPKSLPLVLPFIGGILFFFIEYYSPFSPLSLIFSRRFFFDSFFNYFLIFPFFQSSYHFSFKMLDKGFLEFFGPLGFFRLFLFSQYPLLKQDHSNVSLLSIYFFLSSLLLLLFLVI